MPEYKITLKDGSQTTITAPSYHEAIAGSCAELSDISNVQEVMEDFPDNGASS